MTVGEHQLVFVAGLHRSGTTVLTNCLREHPDVSGFRDTGVREDEGQFLQTVYPEASTFGGPGRFGFAPEAHLTETSELVTAANAAAIFDSWSAHWDLSRRVLVEKSPPNLLKTRFLQALFPGSRFVVIVRHPVAVALAVNRRRPKGTDVAEMLEHWVHCHEIFAADRGHLDHVQVVGYEAFAEEPEATLATIHRFAGLAPSQAQVPVHGGTNTTYLEEWVTLMGSRRHRGLRRTAAALELRVRAFGYSLEDLTLTGPVIA